MKSILKFPVTTRNGSRASKEQRDGGRTVMAAGKRSMEKGYQGKRSEQRTVYLAFNFKINSFVAVCSDTVL